MGKPCAPGAIDHLVEKTSLDTALLGACPAKVDAGIVSGPCPLTPWLKMCPPLYSVGRCINTRLAPRVVRAQNAHGGSAWELEKWRL